MWLPPAACLLQNKIASPGKGILGECGRRRGGEKGFLPAAGGALPPRYRRRQPLLRQPAAPVGPPLPPPCPPSPQPWTSPTPPAAPA